MVKDFMSRPIVKDEVQITIPSGKYDDPKMTISEKVDVVPGNYTVPDPDPALVDIRHATLINGVMQPIVLKDGTILDGKTPLALPAEHEEKDKYAAVKAFIAALNRPDAQANFVPYQNQNPANPLDPLQPVPLPG